MRFSIQRTKGPAKVRPTAVFSAIRGFALVHSRRFLMRSLVDLGWRVIVASREDRHVSELRHDGIEFCPIDFSPFGMLTRNDRRALAQLLRLYATEQPCLIHHFQAKPVIFGCLAAWSCPAARVFNTITGLGHAFTCNPWTRRAAELSYRMSLIRAQCTIFQNPDDRQLFIEHHLVRPESTEIVVSSGVDTTKYQALPPPADDLRVLMVARLLKEKGVEEFVAASRSFHASHPKVRFQLAGELMPEHSNAISQQELECWIQAGDIEFLGHLDSVKEALAQSCLVVLPSYYREGVPRVLLEAAASGRPVITTDAPGCREAVVHEVTGLLVPPRDHAALVQAIGKLLDSTALRLAMGQAGRERAERQFDERIIARQYLDKYRSSGLIIEA